MAADTPAAFFSYSREDLEFALRLAKDLKKAGANVWMDKLDIRPGQLWERKAEEALENCARLLVILSPASVSSRNVMAEVAFALDEQKEVIPVLYRECRIPFRLRPFQYVDFRADYSQGLEELLATVAVEQPQEAISAPPLVLGAVPPLDDHAKLWKLRELRTLTGHASGVTAAVVTPGQGILSASYDKTLKVWDLVSGDELRTLTGHSARVWGVALTGDGQRSVSASGDKTLKVWELATGRELRTLTGHSDGVWGVALTGDRERAVSASWDKTLKVWDLGTGREEWTLKSHSGGVYAVTVTVTPEGPRAVSASWDQTLKVWDLAAGLELRTLTGHAGAVMAVAVTSEGKHAVSASWDKTLKVWDLATGRNLRTLAGHAGGVYAVAVAPDGQRAISASEDKTLKVWELASGSEVATFEADAALLCCTVSPDGKTILAGDILGVIHVLRLE